MENIAGYFQLTVKPSQPGFPEMQQFKYTFVLKIFFQRLLSIYFNYSYSLRFSNAFYVQIKSRVNVFMEKM